MVLRAVVAVGAAAILLAACGSATPIPPPTPTPRFPLISGPITRAPLPPTWTATFTPSHVPPTPTDTATPTPSPTTTLTVDELCERLDVQVQFLDGQHFNPEDMLTFVISLTALDAEVHVRIVHRDTGEELATRLPGGRRAFVLNIRGSQLPYPGAYDWTLAAYTEAHGEVCERSGNFVIRGATVTPVFATSTAESSPPPSPSPSQ